MSEKKRFWLVMECEVDEDRLRVGDLLHMGSPTFGEGVMAAQGLAQWMLSQPLDAVLSRPMSADKLRELISTQQNKPEAAQGSQP